jgi:hypothetical protein
MNRKNAVFVAHEDLVVVDVTFDYPTGRLLSRDEQSELTENYLNGRLRTYTYCALSSWFDIQPYVGDLLLVPTKSDAIKVVRFVATRGIDVLDLDTFEIEYKWIYGFLPQALLDRYAEANVANEALLHQANLARVNAIRTQVRQQLFLEEK